MGSYWNYWAKADTTHRHWHPLACHSLDVAAVARVLVESSKEFFSSWAQRLQLSFEDFADCVCFIAALHDLGKFSSEFQCKVPELSTLLHETNNPSISGYPHPIAAWVLWDERLFARIKETYRLEKEKAIQFDVAIRPWLSASFGHHGGPAESPSRISKEMVSRLFHENAVSSAVDFLNDLIELFPGIKQFFTQPADLYERVSVSKFFSFTLSGLIILSDWTASATNNFPYAKKSVSQEFTVHSPDQSATEYFEHSLSLARLALDRQGVISAHPSCISEPWQELFPELVNLGYEPSPLQKQILDMEIQDEPGLYIIEDQTGSGKTEAALMLYARMQKHSIGNGFYFALPTMATSNGMYERIQNVHRKFYDGDTTPSLILTHGASHLHRGFQASLLPKVTSSTTDLGEYDEQQSVHGELGHSSSISACSQWMADSSRKAFLAQIGVGTIDQALIAMLYSKHNTLRMYGLAQKSIIVDEVHAYDLYMQNLLHNLLEFMALQRMNVILLSATLPTEMKNQLVNAYLKGIVDDTGTVRKISPAPKDFPLISIHHKDSDVYIPVDKQSMKERSVELKFFTSPDKNEPLRFLAEVSRSGRCGVWICNTVKDAQAVYEEMCRLVGRDNTLLFHSRYTVGDRQDIEHRVLKTFGKDSTASMRSGKILIATQVVEQSLDLDFDEMVTDLCPMDLIIQRAGRMKRHVRNSEGNPISGSEDERKSPVLNIFGPAPTEPITATWYSDFFPSGAYVYLDVSVLWKTAVILHKEQAIQIPEKSRYLVESVYGDSVSTTPSVLIHQMEKVKKENQKATAIAKSNIVPLAHGFFRPKDGVPWPDKQAPTRLPDDTVTYRLCVLRQGFLIALEQEEENPWELSSLRYRKMQLTYDSKTKKLIKETNKILPDRGQSAYLLPMVETQTVGSPTKMYRSLGKTQTGEHLLYDSLYGLRIEAREEI